MAKEKKKERRLISNGILSVILLSVLFLLLGAAELINSEFSVLYFYYAIAIACCAVGVIAVCGYFIRKEYLDMTKYGFAAGLFLVILGICVLIRAEDFYDVSMEFFGLLILVHAVILLQYAIQVRLMDGSAAGLLFLFTAIESVIAVLSVAEPMEIFHTYDRLYYGLLALCGLMGLVAILLVKVRSRNLKKEEARDKARIMEDEPQEESAIEPANDDTTDELIEPMTEEKTSEQTANG